MYKKPLSLMLISFLIQMTCLMPASIFAQTDKETQRIAKMKERVNTIHFEKKRAAVTKRDGTKLNGRITEVKDSFFVITDEQTNAPSEVGYDDATQVKTKGSGLSSGAKAAIGLGIAAAVVVLVLVAKPLGKSPFPKCNADRSNAPCDNSQ